MSMSTNVYGIVPPDDKYKKMRDVYDACENASMEIPENVQEFFNYQEPEEKGTIVRINDAVSDHGGYAEDGFDVDLSKVPEKVKVIRFVNSY